MACLCKLVLTLTLIALCVSSRAAAGKLNDLKHLKELASSAEDLKKIESILIDFESKPPVDNGPTCEWYLITASRYSAATKQPKRANEHVEFCKQVQKVYTNARKVVKELADLLSQDKGQVSFVAKLTREYLEFQTLLGNEEYLEMFHKVIDPIEGGLESLDLLQDILEMPDEYNQEPEAVATSPEHHVEGLKQYLASADDISETQLEHLMALTEHLKEFLVERGATKEHSTGPQVFLTVLP